MIKYSLCYARKQGISFLDILDMQSPFPAFGSAGVVDEVGNFGDVFDAAEQKFGVRDVAGVDADRAVRAARRTYCKTTSPPPLPLCIGDIA
jgi:hypothetical protein